MCIYCAKYHTRSIMCETQRSVFFFCITQLLETFSSGVNTGEGSAEAAARAEGEEPQHDTAIYWFSCTHKRQVRTYVRAGTHTPRFDRSVLPLRKIGLRRRITTWYVAIFSPV